MNPAEAFAGPSFPEAKCKGTYDDFFQESEMALEAVARAKIEICFSCIHRQDCLDFALENREVHGIWGGTTPAMRRRIIRKQNEGLPERKVDFRLDENALAKVVRAHKKGLKMFEIRDGLDMHYKQVQRYIEIAKKRGTI